MSGSKRCALCGKRFVRGEDIVRCEHCHARFHRACQIERGEEHCPRCMDEGWIAHVEF